MVREGRVFISVATYPDFGASYYVTAYEVGAQVTSGSSGTTATVRAGHGFAANDKFIVGTDATKYNTVTAVTSTTLTITAMSLSAGDLLVNLGADTGITAPNYNGAGLTIYTDMAYGSVATNNTVQSDANGKYRYYHKGISIWELIRSSLTVPMALYTDVQVTEAEDTHGVRYVDAYATGGLGTVASPWTGWAPFVVEGYRWHFRAGQYSTSTLSVPITASNVAGLTAITGDGSGLVNITITSGTGQFRVYGSGAGTRVLQGVVVRGMCVTPGANNTSTGLISLENLEMQCSVDDLYVDVGATYTTTTGIYMLNCSHTSVGIMEVRGYSVGGVSITCATGLKLYTDDGFQRGNIHFGNVNLVNCTTALKISSSSGSHNNIDFSEFKAVNTIALNGTLAVDLDTNCEQITFLNLHMEKFENGLDASAIENVVVVNGLASQIHNVANNAGAAFTLTNCDSGKIMCRIDTVYNGVVFAGTTTRCEVYKSAAGSITGAYFTDSSSGTNSYQDGYTLNNLTVSGRLVSTGGFSLGTRVASGAIASGVITLPTSPTTNNFTIDTEAAAATDDLDTITGGTDGDIIIVSAANDARDIVVKNSTGNIRCDGDRLLNNSLDILLLQKVGSVWIEISFNDNSERTTAVALTSSASVATKGLNMIELTNTSGTNTPTLVAPSNTNGQKLVLLCVALTAGTITLADSGTCALSAAWIPDAGDTLSLIASGSVWYETGRSAN